MKKLSIRESFQVEGNKIRLQGRDDLKMLMDHTAQLTGYLDQNSSVTEANILLILKL